MTVARSFSGEGAGRHVAVIGAGAVGSATAIEALRAGLRVTVVEPGEAGGPQATSYGNAGWLSSHSVVPPALPGAWRKVPGWLADPLGPLALRWRHLPRALPWLLRYLASGWTEARVQRTADALRTLLADAPALHARLAAEAGVPQLIERRGLLHAYRSREEFEGDALGWRVRRRTGVHWEEWPAAELRRREPDLDARYTLGIFVPEAGHCRNPGAYVAALARHAQEAGAQRVAARATGFRIEGGRLRAVRTDAGEIACDAAAICAGARSGRWPRRPDRRCRSNPSAATTWSSKALRWGRARRRWWPTASSLRTGWTAACARPARSRSAGSMPRPTGGAPRSCTGTCCRCFRRWPPRRRRRWP